MKAFQTFLCIFLAVLAFSANSAKADVTSELSISAKSVSTTQVVKDFRDAATSIQNVSWNGNAETDKSASASFKDEVVATLSVAVVEGMIKARISVTTKTRSDQTTNLFSWMLGADSNREKNFAGEISQKMKNARGYTWDFCKTPTCN